jgi:transposase InsO family protein
VVEQRYQAVLQVLDGIPVTEVAERFGVCRHTVRSAAMELWQMDVTASLFLADGRECKIITGIDDHSRFCVIATVVQRATARAVCSAFVTAMAEYGIPGEVLGDNGRPRLDARGACHVLS